MANIKKIKLSDGSVYSIFDEGALRLNSEGKLITGNQVVDSLILSVKELYITEVDDMPIGDGINNVATMIQENGYWVLKRRSTDLLLKDIGGTSHEIDGDVLKLKIGK